ncbi:MAG: nucleotidyltransferase domain-containing protein [Deinococcales bacterium]|nr:nucleotidyltransferase domain-containing protein [Chitinophagaceae bacterium]
MTNANTILQQIKASVLSVKPSASVILYGSYARGSNHNNSDIDILVLVDKLLTQHEKMRIEYPLYDIEFETGILISPIIFSKTNWETKNNIAPFYHSIIKEGKLL